MPRPRIMGILGKIAIIKAEDPPRFGMLTIHVEGIGGKTTGFRRLGAHFCNNSLKCSFPFILTYRRLLQRALLFLYGIWYSPAYAHSCD